MKNLKQIAGWIILVQFFCLTTLFTGCSSILPGNDPVVVNAERTTAIALDTFDTFLKFEYENKESLEKISKDIHKVAETIRKNGKDWLVSARTLTVSYKKNRSPENKFQLMTAIAVLQ